MPDIRISCVGLLLRLGVSIVFLCLSFHYCSNLNGSQDGFALSVIFRPNDLQAYGYALTPAIFKRLIMTLRCNIQIDTGKTAY